MWHMHLETTRNKTDNTLIPVWHIRYPAWHVPQFVPSLSASVCFQCWSMRKARIGIVIFRTLSLVETQNSVWPLGTMFLPPRLDSHVYWSLRYNHPLGLMPNAQSKSRDMSGFDPSRLLLLRVGSPSRQREVHKFLDPGFLVVRMPIMPWELPERRGTVSSRTMFQNSSTCAHVVLTPTNLQVCARSCYMWYWLNIITHRWIKLKRTTRRDPQCVAFINRGFTHHTVVLRTIAAFPAISWSAPRQENPPHKRAPNEGHLLRGAGGCIIEGGICGYVMDTCIKQWI